MGGKSDLVKGALDLTAKLLGKGEDAISSFKLPKIKPTSDNIHDVGAANFDYYDVVGNKNLPIKDVFGGVDLAQPDQRARVDALKSALSNPEKGYISRLIVDDEGNVIEGQHRLDALRELGASEVPVTMLRDKSRGIDIPAIKNAIQSQGGIHPDQTKQIIDMILEGDPNDYEPPQGFEKWWNIGVNEYNKQRGIKREGYSGKGRVVGDIVDQALKLVAGEGEEVAKTGIRAYHGSPHDFPPVRHIEMPDGTQLYQNMLENPNTPEGAKILQEYPLGRFDMSKIGTGEGAQAYGHGLYFAEHEPVAKGYRDALSRPLNTGDLGRDLANYAVTQKRGSVDDAIAYLNREMANYDNRPAGWPSPEYKKQYEDALAILTSGNWKPAGHMYEVNIAADPNTFLDWDKPLSEQPEVVRKAIEATRKNLPPNAYDDLGGDYSLLYDPQNRPGQFLNTLEAIGGRPNTGEQLLKEAGIPGIKYLDAGSRSAGEGTRNYVVFDDKLISIIRKYGIAGASAMLGYNLMENLDANQAQAATVADKEYQATQPEVRGGMLPPGMEPSGEITSRIPSASERIYDYVRSVLGGDEATKGQRAETVMNIIDQTPLAVGPMAYDIGRGIAEKVAYAEGGAVDPYAEEVASAKKILADKAYNDQSWSDWVGDAAENAVRTARSILPTALGGEGSVGISDIARGAYEGGKDAVMFPGDVITGKQALFDENGVPLESAVGRSFNTAATLGGASSVVPRPANSVGVFGGIKSLTADKVAMRDAMKMESKGATPDEIWDNTGWFRGADGRWRYEIPDIGTTVNSAALQLDLSSPTISSVKTAKLGDYLQHPEFFAAYPQFRSMDVKTTSSNPNYLGMYYPRFVRNSAGAVTDPRIELNENLLSSGDLQKSTLLHEIQHAIQQKEGFAPGTNIAVQPFDRVNPKFERYNTAIQSDPDMQNLMKIQNSGEYRDQIRKSNALFSQTAQPKLLEAQNSPLSDVEKEALYDRILEEYRAENEKIAPLIKEAERLSSVISAKNIPLRQPKEFFTPTEAYLHYAGETEARNVQNRRNLRREDLRGTRPWDTQEYPYMDQLLPLNDFTWRYGYAEGGAVDDDITDALRIAKDVGGGTTPVMLEDAKGNKYDAQGNLIPPTAPGPAPARTPTPQEVGQRAANDPATFDALMQQYAVPDRDIAQYEATKEAVAAQPYETQQMTHVGEKPRREVTVDMPLFGGEYSLGTAPYDAASGMGTLAQTAYDWKTAPFYAIPLTAPIAAGMDVAEGVATEDPLTASLAIGFGPGGKYAKAAGIGAVNYFMDPSEAEAGPARWFSKAVEAARNIPMNKMTGEQALAMLRKGVSPEELKWTNADRFLPGQETITKQDLIDYLEKDRVKTEDVVLGGNKPTRLADVKIEDIPVEIRQKYEPKINDLIEKRVRANLAARGLKQSLGSDPSNPLHLSDDRYLGLLQDALDYNGEIIDLNEAMKQEYVDSIGGLGEPVRYGPGSRYGEKYMTRGGEDYRETLITLPRKEFGNLYQSGHWEGIPNVVGHIRTQVLDVTPPGSNRPYKAFNVDEAQSDYAKAGREKGFGIPKEEYNKLEMKALISREKLLQHYEGLPERHRPTNDEIQSDISRMINGRLPVYINPEGSAKPLVDSFMNDYKSLEKAANALPTAPYVTSTQNWTDLSIKKALDQALDAGADYFTYTPGEVQANRYGLSEDLQSIAYDPVSNTLEYMPKTGGWNAVPQKVPPEKLPEYIGKEMAEKLMAQEGQYVGGAYKKKVLENDDLKLGGHGMRDYYDNIYKKRVEKVVKDATGKKVQWEVIPVQTADGPREQLGFRLTDDFQNARFSDFNKGGRVTGSTKYADSDTVSRALALTSEV